MTATPTTPVSIGFPITFLGDAHIPGELMALGLPVPLVGQATIDLMADVGSRFPLNFPPVSGRKLMGFAGRFLWLTRVGTATAAATFKVGNNETRDNFVHSSQGILAAANINTAGPDVVTAIGGGSGAPDLSSDGLELEIISNPTGLTEGTGIVKYVAIYF